MNCTFEYYFEDFKDIDESEIWWYQTKDNEIKHVSNLCHKIGDLAVYYYTHGYCAAYAFLLKELFPDGIIWNNTDHMICEIDGNFYDASGKINVDESYLPTPPDLNPNQFSKFYNATSPSNKKLLEIMYQKGFEVISQNRNR